MGDIEGGEGRSGESGGREGVLKYPQKVVERGEGLEYPQTTGKLYKRRGRGRGRGGNR